MAYGLTRSTLAVATWALPHEEFKLEQHQRLTIAYSCADSRNRGKLMNIPSLASGKNVKGATFLSLMTFRTLLYENLMQSYLFPNIKVTVDNPV